MDFGQCGFDCGHRPFFEPGEDRLDQLPPNVLGVVDPVTGEPVLDVFHGDRLKLIQHRFLGKQVVIDCGSGGFSEDIDGAVTVTEATA